MVSLGGNQDTGYNYGASGSFSARSPQVGLSTLSDASSPAVMSARREPKKTVASPRVTLAPRKMKDKFPDMHCSHLKACVQERSVHPNKVGSLPPKAETHHEFEKILELIGVKAAQKWSKAREAFRFVDCDHDGSVSRGEVQSFFRSFNLTKEQADKFFYHLSGGKEDDISYKTFVRLLWPYIVPGNQVPILPGAREDDDETVRTQDINPDLKELMHDKELKKAMAGIESKFATKYKHVRAAFRAVDLDADGKVDKDEMRNFFRMFGYSEELADKFYGILDQDNSGGIDYDEFVAIFRVADGQPIDCAPREALVKVPQDPKLTAEISKLAKMTSKKMDAKFSNATEAFRFIDLDQTGLVTRDEAHVFFKMMCIPPEKIDEVFEAFGHGHDEGFPRAQFMQIFGPRSFNYGSGIDRLERK